MAKALLLNVLVNVLGDYIDGLTEENLKVGVWSGKIVLKNLQLNRASIQKLKLPVDVVNAFVEELEVQIPWTSLESSPVKIFINGVYLLITPLNLSGISAEEAYQRAKSFRQNRLIQAEKAVELAALMIEDDDGDKSSSYVQRLTTKIIDNLEINLRNVHIRYEDKQSIPGTLFTFGITLQSFILNTTNADWEEMFVSRDASTKSASSHIVHKMSKITNILMYWNTKDVELSPLEFGEWMREMQARIYSESNRQRERNTEYIIAPPNLLTLKLIHNDAEDAIPKLAANIDSIDLAVNIDKVQFQQVMSTLSTFTVLRKRQVVLQHRPKENAKVAPRLWWKYALKLVCNNDEVLVNKSKLVIECLRHRSRYIDLCTKRKLIENIVTSECFKLTQTEEEYLERVEKTLPIDTLVVFRQFAAKNAVARNKVNTKAYKKEQDAQKAAAAKKSWFSWGGKSKGDGDSKTSVTVLDDDISLEKIESDLDKILPSASDISTFTLDFRLTSTAKLCMTSRSASIVDVKTGLILTGSVRANGITTSFIMTDIVVEDKYTVHPSIPYIIRMQADASKRESGSMPVTPVPGLSRQISFLENNIELLQQHMSSAPLILQYENIDGATKIVCTAKALEICLNKLCIQQMLYVVEMPQNPYDGLIIPEKKSFETKAMVQSDGTAPKIISQTGANKGMEIKLDIEAPKIIIPEDASRDIGYLLLDTGHLSLKGRLTDAGMSWDINLSSVNAGMPLSVDNMYQFNTSLYLIKPFNVKVNVQSIDKTIADMTIVVKVKPKIRGELDDHKLSRVMHLLTVISETFRKYSTPLDAKQVLSTSTASNEVSYSISDNLLADKADPLKKSLDIVVKVEEISLELVHGSTNGQNRPGYSLLSITGLSTHVISRIYDSQVVVDLNSLLIEDSNRHESQMALATSNATSWRHQRGHSTHLPSKDTENIIKPHESEENLISISYISISHKKSPYYKNHATEVDVRFTKLSLNCDPKTVMNLRPFYEVILGKRLTVYQPTLWPEGHYVGALQQDADKKLPVTSAALTGYSAAHLSFVPIGMHVILNMELISLELLRSENTLLHHNQQDNKAPPLESVVVFDIRQLNGDVSMLELIKADISLGAFEIFDTKESSKNNYFRAILSPVSSNISASNSRSSSPIDISLDDGSGTKLNELAGLSSHGHDDSRPLQKQFRVLYNQKSATVSNIDISLLNITSFVSLDTVIDVINVALENTYAVLNLVAKVETAQSTVPKQISNSDEGASSIASLPRNAVVAENSVMAVQVNIISPQLILLDDPTTASSQAIVGKCNISVKYTKETNPSTEEGTEIIHVEVNDMEIFVILNMRQWIPQQILEPMSIEFHWIKLLEKTVVLKSSISLDFDSINGRLSLNDIILAQSIMMRRTLVDSSDKGNDSSVASSKASSSTTISQRGDVEGEESIVVQSTEADSVSLTIYSICITISNMTLVTVNDFNGMNLPLFRFFLDNTSYRMDGCLQDIKGHGALNFNCMFYNSKIAYWEPVLENVSADIAISGSIDEYIYNIAMNAPVVCTLSSSMLATVLETYSILLSYHSNSSKARNIVPALTVTNMLGVPIVIVEPASQITFFQLECTPSTSTGHLFLSRHLHTSHRKLLHNERYVSSLPNSFDVLFSGKLGEERLPIRKVPLDINRPKVLQCLPIKTVTAVSSDPICEEVYQNERYAPLSGNFCDPFMMNDPSAYTDITLRKEKLKSSVKLPDRWEWQGDWTIDKTGKIGVEIDSNGWEYGMNFSAFGPSNKRHVKQALDCVRRRRWIRMRCPMLDPNDAMQRPMGIVWDILSSDDGSKVLNIRSNMQVCNTLPYDVMISLTNKDWNSPIEYGPILKESTFQIPLLHAYASAISIRPLLDAENLNSCTWSQPVPCALTQSDKTTEFDSDTCVLHSAMLVPIHITVETISRCVNIKLQPYITIVNNVLCGFRFSVSNIFRNVKVNYAAADEGFLEAGTSSKLIHSSNVFDTSVKISIGTFGWSSEFNIKSLVSSKTKNIYFYNNLNDIIFALRLKFYVTPSKEVFLHFFSKSALLDRSGLGICIRSVVDKTSQAKLIRTAYQLNTTMVSKEDPIMLGALQSSVPKVSIDNFITKSRRSYKVTTASIDDMVYSDRSFKFTYLPLYLRGQTYICPPESDKFSNVPDYNLFEFIVSSDCVVFVIQDKRMNKMLDWMKQNEYYRVLDQVLAFGNHSGYDQELYFTIHGRFYPSGSRVCIGDSNVFGAELRCMHSVFIMNGVRNDVNKDILDQINYNQLKSISFGDPHHLDSSVEACTCWTQGGKNMCLFQSDNGRISVAVKKGTAWTSEDINIKVVGNSKCTFEVCDTTSNGSYLLVYNVTNMSGMFNRTSVVTIMPHYCIVNCMNELLEVRQKGASRASACVYPYSSEGFHKTDATKGTQVQFHLENSYWSSGHIDVHDVGTTQILLGSLQEGSTVAPPIVLVVEVKIAEQEDFCAVSVIVWRCIRPDISPISLKNKTSSVIYLKQADVPTPSEVNYEICIHPNDWVPFGWADPEREKLILVSIGESISVSKNVFTIDYFKLKKGEIKIPKGSISKQGDISSEEITVKMASISNGYIFEFSETSVMDVGNCKPNKVVYNGTVKTTKIQVQASLLCFSLIADTPTRREIISINMDNLSYQSSSFGAQSGLEFMIQDVQIDNYCETNIFPVCLRRVKHKDKRIADEEASKPFIQFSFIKENLIAGNVSTTRYKYLSFRVLEFALEIDSATIQYILNDFVGDMKLVTHDEAIATSMPYQWIVDYNQKLLSPEMTNVQLVNVFDSYKYSQQSKIYFEQLHIHPMKVLLSFQPTEYSNKKDSGTVSEGMLELIQSFATVNMLEIKVNSFIVSDAIESTTSLTSRIQAKIMKDLQGQIALIAGSLSAIGSPVGLARNIGTGVQDFFYEPYQGLVESPESFLKGLKKGTTSLIGEVVSGAITSTVSIIGTASTGLSYLSGDSEFVKSRNASLQKSQNARSGAVDGLLEGGGQVAKGLVSGVTGLFTKPFEEAKKDGAVGFIKGIGMGVVGLGVKPVLGIADGVSSLAMGISNEVREIEKFVHRRPCRALGRSHTDPAELVVSPFSLKSAFAKNFVLERALSLKYTDAYIADLTVSKDVCVILSEAYLFQITGDITLSNQKIWLKSWGDISHSVFMGGRVAIYLYSSSSGSAEPVIIQCVNEAMTANLYSLLYRNSYKVGNPSIMLPLDIVSANVSGPQIKSDSKFKDDYNRSLYTGEVDGFKFGTHELEVVHDPAITANDKELIQICKQKIRRPLGGKDDEEALDIVRNAVPYKWLTALDYAIWHLIYQWDLNHCGLNVSKCSALLIINKTVNSIQINRVEVLQGREVWVMSSVGYDGPSRTISPNGCVVVFACGHPQSLFEDGHIQVSISTNTFEATIANKKKHSKCESKNGVNVGFLEKSESKWWSKYVLLIE